MDIRNSLDGLKSLLGVEAPAVAPSGATRSSSTSSLASTSAMGSDLATLSSAGSEVSLTAGDGGVRTDKVASVQAALAAGTYNVPASAVASKLVDSMLNGDR